MTAAIGWTLLYFAVITAGIGVSLTLLSPHLNSPPPGGGQPVSDPDKRVIVHCHLCPEGVGRLVTTAGRAYQDAADHALDHHRDQLLNDHDKTMSSIVVATASGPRVLPRPATEGAS
jgi:hypothetical protein